MSKIVLSTVFVALAAVAVAAGPANAAEEIEANAQVCSACHGENGQPIDATIPIIWGQQPSYLMKQLHDYKAGDRESPVMAPFAQQIKQPDLRKTANYFAGKAWPVRATPAVAVQAPAKMEVCRICHQPNFEGGAPAPRLAGQSYEYLLAAMTSFVNDERTNSVDMGKLMKALTPAEREAMARYLAAL
jgi:cytochrome c553